MKNCTNCGIEHPLDAFGKNKNLPLGRQISCRESVNEKQRKRYKEDPIYAAKKKASDAKWGRENPEKVHEVSKRWLENNPERQKENCRRWYKENPEKRREDARNYRAKYPERSRAYSRKWSNKNPEKVKEYSKKWNKENLEKHAKWRRERRATDPDFKLKCTLRNRINSVIRLHKKGKKAGSAVADLGCSVPELVTYLENKFTEEMSWENHGVCWELDHVKPLSYFDLTNREQFVIACHYSNLQPLTVKKHREKTTRENKCLSRV